MTQIDELKKQINEMLSPCFTGLGLKRVTDNIFWFQTPDMIQMVQISFLDKQQSSYFGSTTASFSIEYGALYGSATSFENRKDFPHIQYCYVRGVLRREYRQDAPNKTLSPVEHNRQDIWWVEASGENIDKVIESAVRVIKNDLGLWLRRLADYHYLCRYLFWKNEEQYGLNGFGKIGSPARMELLGRLTEKYPNKTMLKWKLLLSAWLVRCRT